VPSAYCVASWSSSVGYPSVILSFLPSPLLLVVFVRSGCWCVGEYYLYLSLASVVQGLPSAWGLRRTLSERPLEGPVKREKELGIPLSSHHSEVREALEGAAFASFPYSSGISSSSTRQWSLCSGSSKGTNLRNAPAEIGSDRQRDPPLLARPTLEGER
jgi:hypothetical protein